jgi:hypothetical protein
VVLKTIYRINRWYDDLDRDHGVLRMMLCLIPLASFSFMMNRDTPVVQWTGVIGFATFALLRTAPIFFPEKH